MVMHFQSKLGTNNFKFFFMVMNILGTLGTDKGDHSSEHYQYTY